MTPTAPAFPAIATLAILVAASIGCRGVDSPITAAPDTRRPFVAQIDSLTLDETDNFYLGAPSAVAFDSRGRIYVSDSYSGAVLHFKRSGEAIRKFGRKGRGPGELLAPGAMLVIGDSVLVVADLRNLKLVFFDIEGGALVREVKQTGIITSIDTLAAGLLLGRMDVANKTSVALLRRDADTLETFGPVPPEYFESATLSSIHPYTVALSAGDQMIVGATGSGTLYLVGPDRITRDSIVPPSMMRRGVPVDIAEQYNKPASMEEKALLSSALVRAGSFSGGWVGLVHLDYTVNREEVTARAFLSLLHWKDRRACVDREIALAAHARPVVGLLAGTFVVVEQVIVAGPRPVTTVRFFAPDYGVCRELAVPIQPR